MIHVISFLIHSTCPRKQMKNDSRLCLQQCGSRYRRSKKWFTLYHSWNPLAFLLLIESSYEEANYESFTLCLKWFTVHLKWFTLQRNMWRDSRYIRVRHKEKFILAKLASDFDVILAKQILYSPIWRVTWFCTRQIQKCIYKQNNYI